MKQEVTTTTIMLCKLTYEWRLWDDEQKKAAASGKGRSLRVWDMKITRAHRNLDIDPLGLQV